MSIKKDIDALMMTMHRCMMERCIVGLVTSIGIGMSIKKELDTLMMAIQ